MRRQWRQKEVKLRGIDGKVKERAWTRMLRQAPERSAIDLIMCTLLIRPRLSEIEKPQ